MSKRGSSNAVERMGCRTFAREVEGFKLMMRDPAEPSRDEIIRAPSFAYHKRRRLIRFPRNRRTATERVQTFRGVVLSLFSFEATDATAIAIFRAIRAVRVKETREREK